MTDLHPCRRVLLDKTSEECSLLIKMGIASPYLLNKQDIHISPQNITGNIGESNGFFTAYIDIKNNKLRVDHTGDLTFWIEINLPDLKNGLKQI